MVTEGAVWAIFFLPLGSFVVIGFVIRPFLNRFSILSGLLVIGALGTALGLSIWTLRSVILGHELNFGTYRWLEVGNTAKPAALLATERKAVTGVGAPS